MDSGCKVPGLLLSERSLSARVTANLVMNSREDSFSSKKPEPAAPWAPVNSDEPIQVVEAPASTCGHEAPPGAILITGEPRDV